MVAGIEARGFVIAAAVAYATGIGRRPGPQGRQAAARDASPRATPWSTAQATLEVHKDAFVAGQRVLVVDDVLATGGTAAATLGLVERAGGRVSGFTVLLELGFLDGRSRIARVRFMPC